MRRILTETKKKALETIELLTSKNEELEISYENFNKGVFPWEAATTQFQHVNVYRPFLKSCYGSADPKVVQPLDYCAP
jgi:hypothetical protein